MRGGGIDPRFETLGRTRDRVIPGLVTQNVRRAKWSSRVIEPSRKLQHGQE